MINVCFYLCISTLIRYGSLSQHLLSSYRIAYQHSFKFNDQEFDMRE